MKNCGEQHGPERGITRVTGRAGTAQLRSWRRQIRRTTRTRWGRWGLGRFSALLRQSNRLRRREHYGEQGGL